MEALCRLDIVGSPTNPNCAINFVAVASLVVFFCQNNWTDSELICLVTATDVCLYLFAWNRCFFRLLVLGFRDFVCFCLQSCWRECFLSDSVVVLERSFDLICFSSRRRVLRGLESGPSLSCFLRVLYLLFQLVAFFFQLCIFAISFVAFFPDEVL